MSLDELFSRQEALAGFPAKRASTLLYLIENRTAHLAARSLVDFSLTDSAANRDLTYIEAFSLSRAPHLNPTIQHLEHYAPQWRDLIPQNSNLQAALAHTLGQKYNFVPNQIPNIEAALGLKQESVNLAYARQYQTPLATIFTTNLSLKEQLQWIGAKIAWRIEDLPPFWLATLITVALGLPQAFLALPIAAAGMGALSSLALVIAIGVVNVLTMTCMAEAIARSGDFHYGKALIKELTANYLGQSGSLILSVAVGIRVFLIALACYVGLSATMASLTPIPASIWAALLFGIGIYLLSRQSVKFTVAIMIFLAAINIALLSGMSLLAFTHLEANNLFYSNLPFLPGNAFQLELIQQVFGVSLMLYFGHVYVGECAKLVLPKDRSGGSLIKGSIAGTVILTVLFCIWILAVNGAIAPSLLAIQSGTVLEPLAQQIGSVVTVLGSILVIFLLGMAWIRSSSLLFNITQEWIPHQRQPILTLTKERERLILQPSKSNSFPSLGLTYLGLNNNVPQFRLDVQTRYRLTRHLLAFADHWQIKQLSAPLSDINNLNNLSLKIDVRSTDPERVCLKINSSLLLNYEEMSGNADLNNIEFKQQHSNPKDRGARKQVLPRIIDGMLASRRFLLSIIPLTIVFILTEWLFFANTQSFTSVLAFAGVLGNSLVGGIFPILLLVSSRRKGELIPGMVIQKLDRPWLLAGVYSLFIAILLIHGLFIWHSAIARFSALAVVILAVGATLTTIYAGALTPRTVVELRDDNLPDETTLNITAGGKPQSTNISLIYGDRQQHYQDSTVEVNSFARLHYAVCHLPNRGKQELKIWAHRRNLNGNYESLPTQLEVYQGAKKMQFDLSLSGGKVLLPATAGNCWLKFKFSSS